MTKFLTIIILSVLFFNAKGQQKPSINIYELGEPLTTCEMNFKNLFHNWNNDNIINADDFILINYSFVETITDTSSIELYSKLLTDKAEFKPRVGQEILYLHFFSYERTCRNFISI